MALSLLCAEGRHGACDGQRHPAGQEPEPCTCEIPGCTHGGG